jgi:hypothetical protein
MFIKHIMAIDMKNKKVQIVIGVVVLIIVGGASFWGGMAYAKSQATAARAGFATRTGATGRFTAGTNFIGGSIIAKDDQSITIKMPNGSEQIVFYSTSTDIGKTATGTANDLTVGATVQVNGKTNSDGSIAATSIQLRPALPAGATVPSGGNNR